MNHRPYPNRDRARHQASRGRAAKPAPRMPTLGEMVARLESAEHREFMRALGVTWDEAMRRMRAGVEQMHRTARTVPLLLGSPGDRRAEGGEVRS